MAGLAACTSMTLQTRASAMIKSGKLKEGDLTGVRRPPTVVSEMLAVSNPFWTKN